MQKFLTVNDLSFSYGTSPVLKQICFSCEQNERILISGINGSGKTTLLKLISRRLVSSEGEIYCQIPLDYKNVLYLNTSEKIFLPFFTFLENIELLISLQGMNKAEFTERKLYCLNFFKEKKDLFNKKQSELSVGQKHFGLLLFSLIIKNPILIWDEPFRSLDNFTIQKILDFIEQDDFKRTIFIAMPESPGIQFFNHKYKVENGGLIKS